ncbi:MAG: glycosyltransferase family 39 protein, partial [Chloroflexota bacterium]|nr:glycosyltransferase family 39 protein [Chloroflexota bacterium]
WPMGEGEAAQALAAWHLCQGAASPTHSPLLLSADFILFSLFGANDFVARLPLALLGTILALLPYLLRRRLGRIGALAASAILALSPSALYFSRHLGSEMAVATCALASVCWLFGYLDERKSAYLHLGVASLALALSAGSEAYTFLVVLAVCAFFSPFSKRWKEVRWHSLAVTFIACFVLASTCFLLNPSGLGSAADLVPTWLGSFKLQVGSWYHNLLLLLIYEPLVLTFGLTEAIQRLRHREDFGTFLAYWAGGAFLLSNRSESEGDFLLVLVPLALLTGSFLERLLTRVKRKEGFFLAAAVPLLVSAFLELAGYSLVGQSVYLIWAAAAFLLVVALAALYRIWFGLRPALVGVGLALLLVLGTLTLGVSLNLNYRRACDPREAMASHPTSLCIFDLLATLERASSQRVGDRHLIGITVHRGTGPVLAWYLRDFPNTRFVDELPSDVATPVVIAPEGVPVAGDYVGQDFVPRASWTPQGLTWPGRMRWLLYRQAATPVQTDKVVLWMKKEQ